MGRRRIPHLGWWLLAIVPVLLLAFVAPFVRDYYRLQKLAVVAEATNSNSYIECEYRCPGWMLTTARYFEREEWLSFLRTRVTNVVLRDSRLGDEHLKLLPNTVHIESITLLGTGVTTEGLKSLGRLPTLTTLTLFDSPVGDGLPSLLQNSPELKTLVCKNCSSTPEALAGFPALTALDGVGFVNMPITTADCRFLTDSPNLTTLILRKTLIDDGIADLVGHLPLLECVDFSQTRCTDQLVIELANCSRLNWIALEGTALTDRGARPLATLRRLAVLDLSSTATTDAATVQFDRLEHLESIDVSSTAVSDDTLRRVLRLPKLTWADFSGTEITDAGLDAAEDEPLSNRTIRIANTAVSEAALARARERHKSWKFVRERQ